MTTEPYIPETIAEYEAVERWENEGGRLNQYHGTLEAIDADKLPTTGKLSKPDNDLGQARPFMSGNVNYLGSNADSSARNNSYVTSR